MVGSLKKSARRRSLGGVFLLIVAIALVDWRVNAEVPLGLLYLLPVALAGATLSRLQVVLLAAGCAGLAEWFDGFEWMTPSAVPRDVLYLCAFCGSGLFVREVLGNRRRSLEHLRQMEGEMQGRREAEEQLRVLIESSPIAIFTADGEGRVLLANEAAGRLLGVKQEGLAGSSLRVFFPALRNVPVLREGQAPFRTVMQCRGVRADGEAFLAEVWFSTYLTGVGARLAAMVVDTSQDLRDREEENLRHLLAGSRILVGAVSHEVRNICGAIGVVHQNLERTGELGESKDFAALGTLVLALERIAAVDLNEAAEQPTRVELRSFFEELRVVVGPGLREEGIEEVWEVGEVLPVVWADRQSLMQVFLNLVRNSESAMVEGAERRLTVTARVEEERVVIMVADSGGGVEMPELLFRPFQQSSKHVGLGLYLSRALMRSFRGELRYVPREELGAVFAVELMRVVDGDA